MGIDAHLTAADTRVAKEDRASTPHPTLKTLPATATTDSPVRVTGDTNSFEEDCVDKLRCGMRP